MINSKTRISYILSYSFNGNKNKMNLSSYQYKIFRHTQREENLYIKGTSFTIKERTNEYSFTVKSYFSIVKKPSL